MRKTNREKGITLVALVITIVILIILAGVSLNFLLRSNGSITRAKYSKDLYTNATNEEEENLKNLENLFSKVLVGSNSTVQLSMEQLNEYIDQRVNQKLSEAITSNPIGTIIAYSVDNVPSGYLKCEGQAVSRTDYSDLFNIIGTTYGSGDGSTTFNVPDLRGEFLRGTGTATRNTGTGLAVGTHQDATLHTFVFANTDKNLLFSNYGRTPKATRMDTYTTEIGRNYWSPTGTQAGESMTSQYTSRPTNTAVLYCIKY